MGCGRVGASLAHTLHAAHHSVAVIDQNAAAFKRLGDGFDGITITGVGFDRGRLIEAGIEQADAFAAVSSGDNSNILAARTAREVFNVGRVVARIYDPGRAEIYTRLGIPTVGTVTWTTDQILRRIDPRHSMDDWRDPTGHIVVTELALPATWIGTRYDAIEKSMDARVVAIGRYGEAFMAADAPIVQLDDVVHVAARAADITRIRALVAAGPELS